MDHYRITLSTISFTSTTEQTFLWSFAQLLSSKIAERTNTREQKRKLTSIKILLKRKRTQKKNKQKERKKKTEERTREKKSNFLVFSQQVVCWCFTPSRPVRSPRTKKSPQRLRQRERSCKLLDFILYSTYSDTAGQWVFSQVIGDRWHHKHIQTEICHFVSVT